MAFTQSLAEMAADLNGRLAPHGFALAAHPDGSGRLLLTHPDLEAVVQARAFLNHGLCGATHSGIVLELSRKKPELVLESGFKQLVACSSFEPELLAEILLQTGRDVLKASRKFLQDANPLHQQLLAHREAITQAGFYLEPTFFVANLETYRELRRITSERIDLIGVSLDGQGQLVATKLKCAFNQPVPFATALKVMGLGVARS
jgi:hypothetical protein